MKDGGGSQFIATYSFSVFFGGDCRQGALVLCVCRGPDDAAFVPARVASGVLIAGLSDLAVEVLEEGLFAVGSADSCYSGATEAISARFHVGRHFAAVSFRERAERELVVYDKFDFDSG